VQLNSMWEEEMEYRRSLFKAAANGDLRAQEELEREYHVRVRHKNNPRHKTSCRKTKKAGESR
jgi:hypothetical protein